MTILLRRESEHDARHRAEHQKHPEYLEQAKPRERVLAGLQLGFCEGESNPGERLLLGADDC